MAWGGPEATAVMQTRQHKVDDVVTWEGVGMAEQMQSRQAPVQAVEPQVLRQPVLQLVFALSRGQPRVSGRGEQLLGARVRPALRTLSRLWM